MEDCKTTTTPIEINLNLEPNKKGGEDILPYRKLIGTLMYISVATRPDITYAVNYLSRFNDSFGPEHFRSAKRVLRYLKGTTNVGLTYTKSQKPLDGMADADWGACKLDRKSCSGYTFKYAGAAISWASKKQRSVALSTAELEYTALTEAAKEAVHLRSLFRDLGIDFGQITIWSDNQAAIKLGHNPIVSSKSKHIDLKVHYIRDCVKEGVLKIEYKCTEEMEADLLTKALPGPRLAMLRGKLGVLQ
ncbi:uncharacterized protein LOC134660073 [Cydia amplana]|uniref:uncharacterized protein LOC134660073 n=1 Tax=Cydia amplana TaxID=1869771 RepID=UPI002FE551C9